MFAFLFPGQGSQAVGMLQACYAHFPVVRDTFQEAADVLKFDIWDLIQTGPKTKLDLTTNSQPVMLASGIALWRAWKAQGRANPQYFAGHSLGEFSALVAADAMDFEDALRLVVKRGQYMQEAVEGKTCTMAAILGLLPDKVHELCLEAAQDQQVVEIANFNSDQQTVISGEAKAVSEVIEKAKLVGAKRAVELPVSVPSHCSLMRPAAERFSQLLDKMQICTPRVTVLHNVTVSPSNSPEEIKDLLIQQLFSSVRWTETIERMARDGVTKFAECGPGKVLSGINKRINRDLINYQLENIDSYSFE